MLTREYIDYNYHEGLKAMSESIGGGTGATTDTRIADLASLENSNQKFQTAMAQFGVNVNMQNAVARKAAQVGGQ
jgi:hypothetical protein